MVAFIGTSVRGSRIGAHACEATAMAEVRGSRRGGCTTPASSRCRRGSAGSAGSSATCRATATAWPDRVALELVDDELRVTGAGRATVGTLAARRGDGHAAEQRARRCTSCSRSPAPPTSCAAAGRRCATEALLAALAAS